MTAVYVILTLCALLLLLSFVRVGVKLEYSEEGLFVWLKLFGLSFRIFPVKEKNKKQKPAARKEKVQPKEKPGGSFELVRQVLPLAAEAAGELKRKIRVDELRMDLLWSVSDPAACALGFGVANGAVGMIWPILAQNFHIRKHCIRTAVDFDRGSPTVYLFVQMTMRIGQLVSWALRVAVRFFKIYNHIKKQPTRNSMKRQKEAV